MKTRLYLILFLSAIIFSNPSAQNRSVVKTDLTRYVNPMIGTARTTTIAGTRHGGGSELNAQVTPSVTVPFGMTNWTPQTKNTEAKCVAPYYYKDSLITGFRGTHWLSGSCTQDYGSVTIMPVSGKLICNPYKRGSRFSHDDEFAHPESYKIKLCDYDIIAEMSATTRCGIFRFTFENQVFVSIYKLSPRGADCWV